MNFITLLRLGSGPVSFGKVETGCKFSPLDDTFIELRSKLTKGFFILIKLKGFKLLRPKALISKLYGMVSGSIDNFL